MKLSGSKELKQKCENMKNNSSLKSILKHSGLIKLRQKWINLRQSTVLELLANHMQQGLWYDTIRLLWLNADGL